VNFDGHNQDGRGLFKFDLVFADVLHERNEIQRNLVDISRRIAPGGILADQNLGDENKSLIERLAPAAKFISGCETLGIHRIGWLVGECKARRKVSSSVPDDPRPWESSPDRLPGSSRTSRSWREYSGMCTNIAKKRDNAGAWQVTMCGSTSPGHVLRKCIWIASTF